MHHCVKARTPVARHKQYRCVYFAGVLAIKRHLRIGDEAFQGPGIVTASLLGGMPFHSH